ncbi:YncE family protein [candidate division KSB1 bacterium]
MKRITLGLSLLLFFFIIYSREEVQRKYITDGTLIVTNKSDATATFLSLETGETISTLGTGVGPHKAAVSPDGKTAAASNYGERAK